MLKENGNHFITTANNLISYLNKFSDECRNNNPQEIAKSLSTTDIEIIKRLFISGIKVCYLFEVILRYDKILAESLLEGYYLVWISLYIGSI